MTATSEQRQEFISEADQRSLDLVCMYHAVNHVRFGTKRLYSHGCPKCVEFLRNEVRAAQAHWRKWGLGRPAKKAA